MEILPDSQVAAKGIHCLGLPPGQKRIIIHSASSHRNPVWLAQTLPQKERCLKIMSQMGLIAYFPNLRIA